jgi:hypothetical protein
MMEIQRQTWPEEPIIKHSHRPRPWEEPSSSSNPPSDITSEEHLTILWRYLSTYIQNYFPIFTTWICLIWVRGDQHILTMHTRGSSQLRRFHYILQQAGFNPQLPCTFILGHYRRGWIRGAQLHNYWCIALRRVVRRVTLDRWWRVVSSYS